MVSFFGITRPDSDIGRLNPVDTEMTTFEAPKEPGMAADQLLERLIELSLYSEENL